MKRNTSRRLALLFACLLLSVGVATIAHASQATQPTVTAMKGRLALNSQNAFLFMWGAHTSCPDKKIIDGGSQPNSGLVYMGLQVAHDGGSPCDHYVPPGYRAQDLHNSLQNRVLWYEQGSSARQELQGLPEMVDWQARTEFYGEDFDLTLCSVRSTTNLFGNISQKARHGPVVYAIDVASQVVRPGIKNCLTPRRLHAAWGTAYVAGASGMEFYTHYPWTEKVKFDVSQILQDQVHQDSERTAKLKQWCGSVPNVKVRVKSSSPVKAAGFQRGRNTCIVAQNISGRAALAAITIPKLKGNKASVLWEGRRVRIRRGKFSARFTALGTHIYKIVRSR